MRILRTLGWMYLPALLDGCYPGMTTYSYAAALVRYSTAILAQLSKVGRTEQFGIGAEESYARSTVQMGYTQYAVQETACEGCSSYIRKRACRRMWIIDE